MRFRAIVCFALFCLMLTVSPTGLQARTRAKTLRCTATAYSVRGETRDGDTTKRRRTAAADPSVIPLGSRVRVSGAGRYSGVYEVTDTGRKINGNAIDIFIPEEAAAKKFGKKPVTVTILKRGTEKPAEKEKIVQR